MKRERKTEIKKETGIMAVLLAAFILWTAAVSCLDVQAIGPRETEVGFAAFNGWFHELTGVHMLLYTVTDWLGLVPLCFVAGFGMLGFIQMLRRKSLLKVDYSILVLGGFYLIVMAVYVLFEVFIINYRPVLIDGCLEASYPSSTTMLVMCVMPTAVMQLQKRISNQKIKACVISVLCFFIVFMVTGRLVSGVHWFTDIAGGAFLSAGLVMLYRIVVCLKSVNRDFSL